MSLLLLFGGSGTVVPVSYTRTENFDLDRDNESSSQVTLEANSNVDLSNNTFDLSLDE